MKEYGIIYKCTNLLNGKIYIGQTKRLLDERRKAHEKAKDNTHFHRAIQKYGKENFKWEIIDKVASKDEANSKEKYWIYFYQNNNNYKLYNLTKGGDGGDTYSLQPIYKKQKTDFKRKQSLQKLYSNTIGKASSSRFIKIIETNQTFSNVRDLWINFFNSSDNIFINDILKSAKNGTIYEGFHFCFVKQYKKYINLSTLEIFQSYEEVCKKYGQLVVNACKFQTVAYGCYWARYFDGNQYTKKVAGKVLPSRRKSIINLATLKIYDTVKDAEKENGWLHFIDGVANCKGELFEYYDPNKDYSNVVGTCEHKKKTHGIKVICLETGIVYNSITEAENSICGTKNVSKAMKNQNYTAGGYHWEIYDCNKDYTKSFYFKKEPMSSRKILCLETAKIYDSIREAELDTGVYSSGISCCIANKASSSGGFHWTIFDETIDYTNNKFYKKEKHIALKYRKIKCIQDSLVFENSIEASKFYKCNAKCIQRSASGVGNVFKNLNFEYVD